MTDRIRAEDHRTNWAAQHSIIELGRKLTAAITRREEISVFRLREANGEITHDEFGNPSECGRIEWVGQPCGYANADLLMLLEGYAGMLREELRSSR